MNRTLTRILIVLLAFSMMITATACGTERGGSTQPAVSDEPASATETPVQAVEVSEGSAKAEDVDPAPGPTGNNGDIVILYTSDVHCGIDQGFGYAGLQQIRDHLTAAGNEVILVDDGDSIQGEPVGTMTKGEAIVSLMNMLGYDVATPGNHEFDYGMEQFLYLVEKADFQYVSCNFNCKGELVFKPYVILERAGKRIAFVGISTPETLTSSNPANFKDENGEFVYGFFQNGDGHGVYGAVQSAVDAARAEGADYVIAMAHLGNQAESAPYTYSDVITNTTGIDVFFDGHSHDTDQVIVKNSDGTDVPRGAVGTKMACIGWCRIAADGNISTGLYTWSNKEPAPELLSIENEMSRAVADAGDALNVKLNEVVASTNEDLTIYDPVEKDSTGNPVRMIRRAETNLGDLCADAFRIQSGADIAIMGGGGIRSIINSGDITLRDMLSVYPFGNSLCVLEVSGRQILDALEWGAHALPGEFGGFMQTSGLTYEIHTYIDSACVTDENGMFTGVEGERRVKNVLVNGVPIDPQKTYALSGNDYWLLGNGDGFTMFDGASVLQNCVKLDNQTLIDFITESLGGVIGEEYEDPYGQGRIVIVEERP